MSSDSGDDTDSFGPSSSDGELFTISPAAMAAQPSLKALLSYRTAHRPSIRPTQQENHGQASSSSAQLGQLPPPRSGQSLRSSSSARLGHLPSLRSEQSLRSKQVSFERTTTESHATESTQRGPVLPHRTSLASRWNAPPSLRASAFYSAAPPTPTGPLPPPRPTPAATLLEPSSSSLTATTTTRTSPALRMSAAVLLEPSSPTPKIANPTPPRTPAKRRRVDHLEVESARNEAKSRNPGSLGVTQLASRDLVLDQVVSLNALINFDVTGIQADSGGFALKWSCRSCNVPLSQRSGTSKVSLFIEEFNADDGKSSFLAVFAIWIDAAFHLFHACLARLSIDLDSTFDVAGVLTRLGIEDRWSGWIVARPGDIADDV
ncbi:hypothetical protein CF326_g7686 [Tilletia indica]|uniref:Uncharacterized protein n=1 Tax=Tilletia indica TaxID=43049 RepID=A0A8T8SMT2_9BASI|nr:hypothetical protein CF326_g7686 [Tilletia indica]KAE8244220.1 hypothetical protein A4X13_0g6753 [Tilletia indica]